VSVILAPENKLEEAWMRDIYVSTLKELMLKDETIVAMDADLMLSLNILGLKQELPDRLIDCGIQEANMIGVAAGMSATGLKPFVHSFGTFATRRCYDQVFISAAYAKLNVKIIGSDPGIAASFNGGTHMPFEDAGIMRNIPEMTVIEPVDNVMVKDIVKQLAGLYGVYYLRLYRKNPIKIYEEGSSFEIGKAVELKDGSDVSIIASGLLAAEALKAAELVKREGISARVINMFTWKPLDEEMVVKCAQETGAVVTVENHNIINGLGSAVAEALVENRPVPMERIGCEDQFGEVGTEDYLMKRYKMTAQDIAGKVRKVIAKKRN
jgi:transketolase